MWIAVVLDMPDRTRPARQRKVKIVSEIKREGFEEITRNLFMRQCATMNNALMYRERIRNIPHEKISLSILLIADQQIAKSYHYNGRTRKKSKEIALNCRDDIEFL